MKHFFIIIIALTLIASCNNAVNTNSDKQKVIRTIQIDTIFYSNFGLSNHNSFEWTYPNSEDGYIQKINISYKEPWEEYLTYNSKLEQFGYFDKDKNFGHLEFFKRGAYFRLNKILSNTEDFKLNRDLKFEISMLVTKWVWE